jgi:hypothetical protein
MPPPATIASVNRPGLAKTRALPLLAARRLLVVRASSARWRELFEQADIMSEGCVRDEIEGRIWYGTTSLILPVADSDAVVLAAMAARDVHVRLRALRLARREACLRAPARLGPLACETQVKHDQRGVRIDVDVQAPLIESWARSRAAP